MTWASYSRFTDFACDMQLRAYGGHVSAESECFLALEMCDKSLDDIIIYKTNEYDTAPLMPMPDVLRVSHLAYIDTRWSVT